MFFRCTLIPMLLLIAAVYLMAQGAARAWVIAFVVATTLVALYLAHTCARDNPLKIKLGQYASAVGLGPLYVMYAIGSGCDTAIRSHRPVKSA